MRTTTVYGKPPSCRGDGGHAYIDPDNEVADEEPAGDERVLGRARWLLHDVDLRRVEAQSSGRQAVRDQVHPQQLDRDERLWQTQRCRQEYTGERRRRRGEG